ncbi:MAG: hypothetical protein V9E94_01750 [Microthrixaceae bacterium]
MYNDNNEYFAKIQPLLSQGKAIAPNVLAPTYWMAARLINLGWVEKLPLRQDPELVEPGDEPPEAAVGPDGRVLAPVAGRYGRNRLQHQR